ncbi:MAG TPA: hypothetical protein VFH47_03910 [Candidatus Thermoplasmatota archaeon]|nr:hypothetical protein [Candidatus Thermoplasmatota archaeon]
MAWPLALLATGWAGWLLGLPRLEAVMGIFASSTLVAPVASLLAGIGLLAAAWLRAQPRPPTARP